MHWNSGFKNISLVLFVSLHCLMYYCVLRVLHEVSTISVLPLIVIQLVITNDCG